MRCLCTIKSIGNRFFSRSRQLCVEIRERNAVPGMYERPLSSLLANRPLLLQPQQAAHKHETGVANPQYLILYIIKMCSCCFFILNDESMLYN